MVTIYLGNLLQQVNYYDESDKAKVSKKAKHGLKPCLQKIIQEHCRNTKVCEK
jgi:hypothetical protein